MARGATLALKITGDAKDGVRALNEADDAGGRFSKSMGAMAAGAGLAVGAIGLRGQAAFDSASALEQSTGGVAAVFGEQAAQIEASAAGAAAAFGLSKNSYQELATVLGSQLKNAGIEDFAGQTEELIGKGADMAAVFGGSTADAVAALSSALKGEMDPIEKYGVTLNQSAIDAKLAALGLDGLEGSAGQAAKAQAVLALVNEQSAQTMGASAAESDSAAAKMGQLSAMWENAKATLGEKLLPIFVQVADFIQTTVAPVFERLTAAGGPLSTVFSTVAGFVTGQLIPALMGLWNELAPKVIPILETVGRIITNFVVPAFMTIWGIIQQYVVPIFKSVLGPALEGVKSVFGAVEGALERNAGKFSGLLEKVRPLLDFLKNTVAPFIGGALKTGFEVLSTVIGKVVDAIAWVLDKAASVAGFIGDVGGFLFGGAAPATAGGGGGAAPVAGRAFGAARGAPALFGASSSLGGGTGPSAAGGLISAGNTYQITITGALDPVAVGRQLDGIMRQYARTTGRTPSLALGRA